MKIGLTRDSLTIVVCIKMWYLQRDCSTAVPSGEAEGETVTNQGVIRNCVLLKGIPWDVSVEKIITFFGEQSSNIVEDGVHLLYDRYVSSPFIQL